MNTYNGEGVFIFSVNVMSVSLRMRDCVVASPPYPSLCLCLLSPPSFWKPVSTQLRVINPFCDWSCCCTLFICLRSTHTTAGSPMITPPHLAACQAEGHCADLQSSLISCMYTVYVYELPTAAVPLHSNRLICRT